MKPLPMDDIIAKLSGSNHNPEVILRDLGLDETIAQTADFQSELADHVFSCEGCHTWFALDEGHQCDDGQYCGDCLVGMGATDA